MNISMIWAAGIAVAVAAPVSAKTDVLRFTAECEEALALSAGPVSIREHAGVYVLGDDGFELRREATNNYMCMVTREQGAGIAPQCFDEPGQVSHVPFHLAVGERRVAGESQAEITKMREAGFASGAFRPAPAPGVVYMASDYNFIVNSAGDKLHVGPHVMYHAPFMTDAEIGVSSETMQNRGMPFINDDGPLGFMIGFVEKPTDKSDVVKNCAGQLPDPKGWRAVP